MCFCIDEAYCLNFMKVRITIQDRDFGQMRLKETFQST